MSPRVVSGRRHPSAVASVPSLGTWWTAADWSGARPFALSLAGAVLVFLARIHEVITPLSRLYPAKVIALPLIVTALIGLRRDFLARALGLGAVRCVVLIAALAVLSVPGSAYPRASFMFLTGPYLRYLVFFILVAAGFADRRVFHACLIALVIGVSIAAARALMGWNANYEAGRFAIGGTYDPNASASLFVLVVPFALLLASRGGIWQWLWFGSALILAGAVMKTGSRGGMLGMALITPWLLYVAPRRRRVLYIGGVVLGVILVVATMSETQRGRFASIFSPSEDYNMTFREGRIEVWKRGLGYMATNPVLGVGVEGFPFAEGTLAGKVNVGYGIGYTAAHNSFIQIGAELGVLGLATFVVMWILSAQAAWRVRTETLRRAAELPPPVAEQEVGLANACIGGLIGTITTGFFLSLAYDPIVLFIVAACAGLVIGSPFATAARRSDHAGAVAPDPVPIGPGWRSGRFRPQRQTRGNRRGQRGAAS
jgi:O-antigen ligase